MTPDLVVPDAPIQTDEAHRSLRVAFLRQRFPHGVQAHQFADMLYALDIAEAIFPAVVHAVATRAPRPMPAPTPPRVIAEPPPRMIVELPPAATPLSKGAVALIKLIEETPRISIEKLATELGYKQGYIQQLVAEARRAGTVIDTTIDGKTKIPRYAIVRTSMRESRESKAAPPSVQ